MNSIKRRELNIVLSIIFIIISIAWTSRSEAQYLYPPLPAVPVFGFTEGLNPLLFSPSLLPAYYPFPLPLVSFPAINPLILMTSPLSAAIPVPTAVSAPLIRTAAQAGTWVGTWQSTFIAFIILYHSGPMTLDLIENPLLQSISGTAILQGSRYTSTLFDVRGVLPTTSTFEVSGTLPGGYAVVLSCILTSPTTITGTYTVNIGFGGILVDKGIFNLTLL
ncbi:MAG: hypothetical protein K6U11_00015 [bacterium]|nr:hypothetical protein [bacterium]